MKECGQLLSLCLADGAFSIDEIRNLSARANQVDQVCLRQTALLHQVCNHLMRGRFRQGGMNLIVIFDQLGQEFGEGLFFWRLTRPKTQFFQVIHQCG